MKLLLDENVPKRLKEDLIQHEVFTVREKGWNGLKNGELLKLMLSEYPMTGRPDKKLPDGWEQIPGARGCTPQSCSFRDHYNELQKLNTRVFGLSTQTTDYQNEVKNRLHLPYDLLSDKDLEFANALNLPFHLVDNMTLIKRVTLIFEEGKIIKYFYPVFPPDKNIDQVIDWLKDNEK